MAQQTNTGEQQIVANNGGIIDFLKKASEVKKSPFDEAKANQLIEHFGGDPNRIVEAVGKTIGVKDLEAFKRLSFEKYGLGGEQPTPQPTQTPEPSQTDQYLADKSYEGSKGYERGVQLQETIDRGQQLKSNLEQKLAPKEQPINLGNIPEPKSTVPTPIRVEQPYDYERDIQRADIQEEISDVDRRVGQLRTDLASTRKENRKQEAKAVAEEVKAHNLKLQDAISQLEKNATFVTSAPGEVRGGIMVPKQEDSQKVRDLRDIQTILKKIQKEYEAPQKGEGELQGLWWGLTQTNTARDFATLGMNEMMRAHNVRQAFEKEQAGEPLTEEEATLLDTYKNLQAITQQSDKNIGTQVGSTVQEMLPFMVQFAATSGIGASARTIASQYIKNQLAKTVAKGVAGTAAQVATMPYTYQRYAERRAPVLGEDGNLTAGETPFEAGWKSIAETAAETLGENWASINQRQFRNFMVDKMSDPKVASTFLGKMATRLSQETGVPMVQSAPFELLGEYYTGIMQSAIDQDASFFDPEQQKVLLLSVALASGGASVASVPMKYSAKKSMQNAQAELDDLSNDDYRDAILGITENFTDPEEMMDQVIAAAKQMNASHAELLTGLKYAGKTIAYNQMNDASAINVQRKINEFKSNDGTLTSAIVDGKKVTVRNPENLGQPGKAVFVKNEDGTVKMVNSTDIKDFTVQNEQDVVSDIQAQEEAEMAELEAKDAAVAAAAQAGIEPNRTVKTPSGIAKVVDILPDNTIAVVDAKGNQSSYMIDEVEAYKTDEQKKAEAEAEKQQIEAEKQATEQAESQQQDQNLLIQEIERRRQEEILNRKGNTISQSEVHRRFIEKRNSDKTQEKLTEGLKHTNGSVNPEKRWIDKDDTIFEELIALGVKPDSRGVIDNLAINKAFSENESKLKKEVNEEIKQEGLKRVTDEFRKQDDKQKFEEINTKYDAELATLQSGITPQQQTSTQTQSTPQQQTQEQIAETPQYPVLEDGSPDYDSMAPEQFYDVFSNEFGQEAAMAEITDMSASIDKKIQSLQKKRQNATSANQRATIAREIKSLTEQGDNLRGIIANINERTVTDADIAPAIETRPELQEMPEADRNLWIAENSTDPNEIAEAFEREKQNSPAANLTEWQKATLGVRFTPESFRRHGDWNNMTKTMAKAWISNDGVGIDQFVKDNFEDVPGFEDVTTQDVVDFITANPSGSVRSTTDTQNMLRKKYATVTGKSINTHKFDIDTNDTQVKLDNFLRNSGVNMSELFSTEDVIEAVDNNRDKLSDNEYNEFIEFLDSEIRRQESEAIDWLESGQSSDTAFRRVSGNVIADQRDGDATETKPVATADQYPYLNISDKAMQDLANRPRLLSELGNLSNEIKRTANIINSSEIPANVQEELAQKGTGYSTGFYANGQVYILSDMSPKVSEAVKTYIHEVVVHQGFRELFRNSEPQTVIGRSYQKFNDLLADVYGSMTTDQIQKLAKEYAANVSDINQLTADQKYEIAEEFLAHMAELELTPTAFQEFIDRLLQIIKKAFKFTNAQFTRSDLLKMINERRTMMSQTPEVKTEGDIRARKLINTHTETQEFKDWFKNSKVVDDNGDPLIVYHGSPNDFNVFKLEKSRQRAASEGYGFYFTDNKEIAEGYKPENGKLFEVFLSLQKPISKDHPSFSKIQLKKLLKSAVDIELELYDELENYKDGFLSNFTDTYSVSFEKALTETAEMLQENDTAIDQISELANVMGSEEMAFKAVTKALGYDGIYVEDFQGGEGAVYIAWYPNQIKSATGNNGKFDPTNNDIRFRMLGQTGASNLDNAYETNVRMDNLRIAEEMEKFERNIIKDENNKPKIFYHGSKTKGIENLSSDYLGTASGDLIYGSGIYLTEDKAYADQYRRGDGEIYLANISLSNPLKIKEGDSILKFDLSKHDGVIVESFNLRKQKNVIKEIVVFDSKNVRLFDLSEDSVNITPKSIRLATGWERGVDGQWRYETPDGNLSEDYRDAETLSEAWDDKELFKAYPQMKDVRIGSLDVVEDEEAEGLYIPSQIDDMPTIHAIAPTREELRSVMAHEIQHAIQDIEGFAKGGIPETSERPREEQILLSQYASGKMSAEDFLAEAGDLIEENELYDVRDIIQNNTPEQVAALLEAESQGREQKYKSYAGEVEARNVQSRIDMTPEQRANTLLSETEDVERGMQIVSTNSKESALKMPETITVDGVERPTKNSKRQSIHPTIEGIENFWKWFGDSKVVDEKGRPLVMYHATQSDFNEFSKNKIGKSIDFGTLGSGFYFTDSSENANNYARNLNTNTGKMGNESIMPVYLSIENPYDAEKLFAVKGDSKKESDKFTSKLRSKGFDGAKFEWRQDFIWYVAFSPTQIKSATGNLGDFSNDNPDIRFRVAESNKELEDFVKDSKVKETVYHGTDVKFEDFKEQKGGKWASKVGFWFTNKTDYAEMFGSIQMPVKISMKNPVVLTQNQFDTYRALHAKDEAWWANKKQSWVNKGYDGILVKRSKETFAGIEIETPEVYAVFTPQQTLVLPSDDIRSRIEQERSNINTDPSQQQKEAGNYKKGHVSFDGFDISIENPLGSTRSGTDRNGKKWSVEMPVDYGYFKGTTGADKDHIDVMIGEKPELDKVYIVDQIDQETGKFDEHKVMIGFDNISQARKMYNASFEKGWSGLGKITRTNKQDLKEWFKNGDMKKPFSGVEFEEKDVRFRTVYHGTPHKFDRFSTDKIGTGEGAQAFGWGLYFTDKKSIAEDYAKRLSKQNAKLKYKNEDVDYFESITFLNKHPEIEAAVLEVFKEYPNKPVEDSFKHNPLPTLNSSVGLLRYVSKKEIKSIIESGRSTFNSYGYFPNNSIEAAIALKLEEIGVKLEGSRNLYSVEIHQGKEPGEYDYLRWDKPISKEQRNKIIEQAKEEGVYEPIIEYVSKRALNEDYDGNFWYGNIRNAYRSQGINKLVEDGVIGQERFSMNDNQIYDKATSLFLLRAGIDGIQYPTEITSKGSHEESFNYVIFDESAVEIKEHVRFRKVVVDGKERPTTNSNGNEIHPTEEGIKNFWRWFGDSKVVDKQGRPLVVYHGSPDLRGFKESYIFKTSNEKFFNKDDNRAYFFTDSFSKAKSYADPMRAFDYQGAEEGVISTYISIKNPLIVNAYGAIWRKYETSINGTDIKGTRQLVEFAQKNNYGGLIVENVKDNYNNNDKVGSKPGNVYVAFSPTQIKSATGNLGDFSNDNPDIRFRKVSDIGFYSTIENALNQIKQEKGTSEQFKAMLLKNGAKQAEMDWTGWDEQFPDARKMITKADVQNWIEQNKIEVQEVVKGSKNTNTDRITIEEDSDGTFSVFVDGALDDDHILTRAQAERIAERRREQYEIPIDDTKYSQYQEPGGSNYKEVLLTMPFQNNRPTFEEWKEHLEFIGYPQNEITIEKYNKDTNWKNERGLYAKDQIFKSSHFEEPNILAHVRFNEREVNGEKVLFLEEVQSDWAQEGREKGFEGDTNYDAVLERENVWDVGGVKVLYFERGVDGKNYRTINKNREQVWFKTLDDAVKQANETVSSTSEKEIFKVPSMPFRKTDQWVNLALRRMMRYASENGFDRIAWTNGEQQAARYDLSKQVDVVFHKKNEDGTYHIEAMPKGAMVQQAQETIGKNIPESELEGVVGKDLARKIIDTPETDDTYGGFYAKRGVDLKVGGEGMKAFYDAIIPSAASKLGKPFGAKPEQIKVNDQTVLSIPVTEKMKTETKQGMPLFRLSSENDAAQKILDAYYAAREVGRISDKIKGIEESIEEADREAMKELKKQLSTLKQAANLSEKDTRRQIQALQNGLVTYAKKHMPTDKAGKLEINTLLGTIKNTNKPEAIEKALEKIDEITSKVNRKVVRRKSEVKVNKLIQYATTNKKAGDMERGKFNIEDTREFAKLKRYNDEATMLGRITRSTKASEEQKDQARGRLDKMIDELSAESSLINSVAMKLVQWRAMGAKTSDALIESLKEDLEYLYETAKDAKKEADIIYADKLEADKEFIKQGVRGTTYDKQNIFKKLDISLNDFTANLMGNWETLLTMLGGLKARNKYSLIMPQVNEDMGVNEAFDDLLGKAMTAYGFDSRNKMLKTIQSLSKLDYEIAQPIHKGKRIEGEPDKISKMHIIDIYNAIKNDNIKKSWEKSYGEDIINNLVSNLSEADKMLGDAMMEIAGNYGYRTNAVYVDMFNHDRPDVGIYWPSSALNDSDVDVMQQYFEEGKIPSFFKKRASNRTPKPVDAFGKFTKHVKESEWLLNKAVMLNNLNKVFRDQSVKKLITQSRGQSFYNTIIAHLKKQGLRPSVADLTTFEEMGGAIVGNWAAAKIGASISVPLKQLISVVNYSEDMPVHEWALGFAKAMATPLSTKREMWNIPYVQNRFSAGYTEALQHAMNATSRVPKAKSFQQRIKDFETIGTRGGDILAVMFGGKPYYDYLIKKGYSQAEAEQKFIEATIRSQQSPYSSTLSIFQNSKNPLSKAVFMFANTPSQYMRKMFEASQAYRHGDLNAKQVAKIYTIYSVANAILFVGASAVVGMIMKGADPDDEFWENVAVQTIVSFFGGMPLINDIVESTTRQALGLHIYDDALPVIKELNDIRSNFLKVAKGDYSDEEKRKEYLKRGSLSMLELAGLSATNAVKTFNMITRRSEVVSEQRSKEVDAELSRLSKKYSEKKTMYEAMPTAEKNMYTQEDDYKRELEAERLKRAYSKAKAKASELKAEGKDAEAEDLLMQIEQSKSYLKNTNFDIQDLIEETKYVNSISE